MNEPDSDDAQRTARLAQLGTLFAGFAHEIRNPLSTISLNLQLVMEELAGAEGSRERRTYKRLWVVESEVKRLQAIVEEFLGYVRWPAPRKQPVDLNRLLRSLGELFAPELEARGIAMKVFPGAAVGEVSVDPDHIRAAIVNLLRNAKDACSRGDEVLLSSKRAGDEVLVQVTDTGPGMTKELAERAFTPYFSTKKGGTGLGLAIARRTLEEHGGRLELSSEPGRGTQFTLRLPADAGRGSEQSTEPAGNGG
jgi:signal transduction histidine kinase